MHGRRDDLGIYVHLPFCPHVCPYCDFAVEGVGTLGGRLEREYVEGLLRELALEGERLAVELEGCTLATVYLGGGTPSLCSTDALGRILEAVRAAFPGEPEEVTLEVNPGWDDPGRARAWRALGIDRVSVGVQALDDASLRRLGRAHTAAQARAGLERCLAAGFRSTSADLIYGVPGQAEETLLAGLAQLLELCVPHVSTYALTLEPGTAFARAVERGRLRLPGDGCVRRAGRRLRAELRAAGLRPYEISSAARPGHVAVHNTRYWLRQPVLGLGVSAASLLDETRFQNPRDRASWRASLAPGRPGRETPQRLDRREQQRETLALGLRRLEGVSRAAFRRRFGIAPERAFPREVAELLELELCELRADRLRLSERGIAFADEVFLRFVGR